MDLGRRIRLYVFGVAMGGLLAWGLYGDRLSNNSWTPSERVKLRLRSTLIHSTPAAAAQLEEHGLTLNDLRLGLDSAEIDFKASHRTSDSLWYVIHAPLNGRDLTWTCTTLRDYVIDSTATLLEIQRR